ncbi:unnamed protein product [Cylicocyclus nassatus]|uniref:BHLH domain-containing protein n=1 Tax=Cylicocyclus nassatus TaxID=53992 RepID=A0AA36H9G3_CYLNA|nr:unnamed protein product [Cylicocyclus nassatus]
MPKIAPPTSGRRSCGVGGADAVPRTRQTVVVAPTSSAMSSQVRGSRPNQERRNARERSRVHQVNHGFDLLRTRVPKAGINKKLSKADTLREAVRYIQYLQSLLLTDGGMNQTECMTQMAQPCSVNQSIYQQSEMEFDVYFPSNASSIASQQTSPTNSVYAPPQLPPYNHVTVADMQTQEVTVVKVNEGVDWCVCDQRTDEPIVSSSATVAAFSQHSVALVM